MHFLLWRVRPLQRLLLPVVRFRQEFHERCCLDNRTKIRSDNDITSSRSFRDEQDCLSGATSIVEQGSYGFNCSHV